MPRLLLLLWANLALQAAGTADAGWNPGSRCPQPNSFCPDNGSFASGKRCCTSLLSCFVFKCVDNQWTCAVRCLDGPLYDPVVTHPPLADV